MSCPECERKTKAMNALATDLHNAETDLIVKRREVGRLKAELTKQRKESPEAKSVVLVFDHWRNALKKRKSVKLGPEREKRVLARLRDGFSEDDLKQAIDGCALVPYVGAHGRKPEGKPKERFDDLALICRDETTVERFMRYSQEKATAEKASLQRRHAAFLERHAEELAA